MLCGWDQRNLVYRDWRQRMLGGVLTPVMVSFDRGKARSCNIFTDSDDVLAVRGGAYPYRSGGCDKMGQPLFFQPYITGLLFSILGIRIRRFN